MELRPTTSDLEQEFRDRLRGARLILEAGIAQRDLNRLRPYVMAQARVASDPGAVLVSKTPAVFATYLVAQAIYSYDGAFWPHVLTPIAAQRFDADLNPGWRFTLALDRLGLEGFEDLPDQEKTWRWVSRILAHAGVPVTCAPAFFDLLRRELRHGARQADELLSGWRASRAQLEQLYIPTKHFLLYGGETAVDLVARCIDLVEASRGRTTPVEPEDVGLPPYLVEAYADLPPEKPRRNAHFGTRGEVPRPTVVLDPYDGFGPAIRLPMVDPDRSGGKWHVDTGREVVEVPASALQEARVRVHPATAWSADYTFPGELPRSWTFEGLDRVPALIADPERGEVVRDPSAARLTRAWVISAPTAQLVTTAAGADSELRDVSELPALAGSWSEFRIRDLNLDGSDRLTVADPLAGSSATVRLLPARLKPYLDGPLADGVETESGAPVYSAWPDVCIPSISGVNPDRWKIQLAAAGHITAVEAVDQVRQGAVSLGDHAPTKSGAIHGTVTVRGPLGSDAALDFAVVPGLQVTKPATVLLPTQGTPSLGVGFHAQGGGIETAKVEWPERGHLIPFSVPSDPADLALRLRVPRLEWVITHETKPALAVSPSRLRIGSEEFEDELADVLSVRTGLAGVELMLRLAVPKRGGGNTTIQQSHPSSTRGPEGRWSFDLGRFADTIRASEHPTLTFYLDVGPHSIPVADVVARLETTGIEAASRCQDEFSSVLVTFDHPRPIHGRVIRLWSVERPWEPSIEESIADGDNQIEVVRSDGSLPVGRYLAEVAIREDWIGPARPTPGQSNVATIQVGTDEQVADRVATQDLTDPLAVFQVVLAGRGLPEEFTPPPAGVAAEQGVVAAVSLLKGSPPGDPRIPGLRTIGGMLVRDASAALVGVAASSSDETGELRRLALRIAPAMFRRPSEPGETPTGAWTTAPLIAAALDLRRGHADDSDALARCERFLGWKPGDEIDPTGGLVRQQEAGRAEDELVAIQSALGLVPEGLLSPVTLQLANFEWLIAEKRAEAGALWDRPTIHPTAWYAKHSAMFFELPEAGLSYRAEDLEIHAEARTPPRGTYPWASLPLMVLSAAMHLMVRDSHASAALEALDEALVFAPRLVEHDVALAMALIPADVVCGA